MPAASLLGASLLALALSTAAADTVRVEAVAGRVAPSPGSLRVRGQWLDEPFDQALTDNGAGSEPTGDGIWSTTLSGPPTRMLQLELVTTATAGPPIVLASTTEAVADGDTLSWALPTDGSPRAVRVALARPARELERFETATTVAGFGWLVVAFGVVVWLVDGRLRSGEPRRRRRRERR